MDDIKNDPRFSRILFDPRFRPVPKSKRKVKIDSRFKSLFTNTHFSHRTDIDKRGRPVLDTSKKNKHVMERFYEISSSESDDEKDDAHEDSNSKLSKFDIEHIAIGHEKQPLKAKKKNSPKSLKTNVLASQHTTKFDHAKVKKRKHAEISLSSSNSKPLPNKKNKSGDPSSSTSKNEMQLKKKGIVTDGNDEDQDGCKSSSECEEFNNSETDGGIGDDDTVNNASGDDDDELPEFTKEFVIEETEVDHKWNELHMGAPLVTESTHRLAVCNMDWDFVKAQDLFVLFKSFVPDGGHVKSVTIYPSEFGKERMAEEARLGPKEIRKDINSSGSLGEEKDGNKKKGRNAQKRKQEEKEREALQTEKLREYQLNRLRYFYAVVDCDSVRTADSIYSECDGREYLLSSVRLDLRFIPDNMTFDDDPKEQFSENQSIIDYQPSQFNTTALSQAKVDVTWDETDFDRLSKRVSGLQPKELESIIEENKYADIIAPPESDSEEDSGGRPEWLSLILEENDDKTVNAYSEEEKIQLYRKLLMDKMIEEKEEERKKEEEDIDKEIEWQPGLKSAAEKKIKKKEKKNAESALVNEYLEKKKGKKQKKREEKVKKKKSDSIRENGENEGEQAFSDDEIPHDFNLDDLNIDLTKGEKNKRKKKKGKGVDANIEEEIDERDKAELELMVMDVSGDKHLSKPKEVGVSMSKKKKKKLAKLKKSESSGEEFNLDLNDSRFSALYTTHHFHIDPNAPQFKKTKNMVKLVDEQIKRKFKKAAGEEAGRKSGLSDGELGKSVSQSLVESLKRKMKK